LGSGLQGLGTAFGKYPSAFGGAFAGM